MSQMFRVLHYAALMVTFTLIAGCATWRDSSGQAVPSAETLDCDRQCAEADPLMDRRGSSFCVSRCMRSKGYYFGNAKDPSRNPQ
jgi:hypothetical protein